MTLDYIKNLEVTFDWHYDGEEETINTDFIKIGETFSDEQIKEYIDIDNDDMDDLHDNLIDLIVSEYGDNTIIETLTF